MNKHVAPPQFNLPAPRQRTAPEPHPSTQGAQDWPRLAWTLDMFDRASELGLFGKQDRIELIRGELVPMAAKGVRHERVRDEVLNWFMRRLPLETRMASEPGWRLNSDTYLEPDIIVYDGKARMPHVPAEQILLGVEVSHSSLGKDYGPRATLLAELGVRCYWVIDVETLMIHSFDGLTSAGYAAIGQHSLTETVTPSLVPALALRLADLGIDT